MERSPFLEDTALAVSMCWGCVFCTTGSEEAVARALRDADDVSAAFAVRQIQHHSEQGVKSTRTRVMMPGYVFFLAEEGAQAFRFQRLDGVIRVLNYDQSWPLAGDDLLFAQKLAVYDGMLGMSKVYKEGERIVIESGPLKDFEGIIQKVDRHNRNGLVSIAFGGKEIKAWLAFEYVAEAKG